MHNKTRKLVYFGIFTALAIILQRISFPIIPMAPFLKLEFSSIPIITLAILFSYQYALLTAIIVNLFDFLVNGSLTGLPIDQGINVIAIAIFVLVMKYFIEKKQYSFALIIPVSVNAIALLLLNYFFLTPFYFSFLKIPLPQPFFIWTVQVYGVFNIIKWGMVGIMYVLIYKSYFHHLKNKNI